MPVDDDPRLTRVDGFGSACGQIDPEPVAIGQGRQAQPVEDMGFIAVEIENRVRRRAVKKMNSTLLTGALQRKAAHPVTGQARHVVVPTPQGKAKQIDQPLPAAGQVSAQAEQALAVAAKALHPQGHGSAVRPKDLVAFIVDGSLLSVA